MKDLGVWLLSGVLIKSDWPVFLFGVEGFRFGLQLREPLAEGARCRVQGLRVRRVQSQRFTGSDLDRVWGSAFACSCN